MLLSISILQHDSISIETTNNRLLIQSFVAFIEFIEQTFRDCHYAATKIKIFFKNKSLKLYLNIDCFMSIENKQIFKQNFSNVIIRQLSSFISIRDIKNIKHHISKYVVVFFISMTSFNKMINHEKQLIDSRQKFIW